MHEPLKQHVSAVDSVTRVNTTKNESFDAASFRFFGRSEDVSYRKAVAVAVTYSISYQFGYARKGIVMAFGIVARNLVPKLPCSVEKEEAGRREIHGAASEL